MVVQIHHAAIPQRNRGGEGGPAGGAAWHVKLPLTGAAPKQIASWAGVKPEALGRAADGALVVFFDGGDAPPRYTRLTISP